MTFIHRHNRCRGIRLWRWRRFQVELWFCPAGEFIEPHVHSQIDSKIILLYGWMEGRIGDRAGIPHKFKGYNIPKGVVHSAHALSCCLFLNVERWKGAGTPKSACEDFQANHS